MTIRKLSSSFSGSATRGMSSVDREVESRMKRLDVFTDDFSPPGTAESSPGQDYNKRAAPYGKPHDDTVPEADPQFWDKSRLHSAGDPKDQEKMDWLDEQAYKIEAPIKNPYDQFPGTVDMEDHKQETKFDDHLTDPARLRKMADKKIDGPESFHKEVEKRMKRLAIEKVGDKTGVAEDPKPTKDPKWNSGKNPDQEMSKKKALSKGDDVRDESMMKHGLEGVDEGLWAKAKSASQQAFGKIKWPFVQYWYKEHGGK